MKLLKMRYITVLLAAILLASNVFAGDKTQKEKPGINWMTWDDVQVAMKKKPKKVWVDIYTDWCGWCKRMDHAVYSNPDVIKYINDNFYAVKFNPEKREDVMFLSKTYSFSEKHNANMLAVELMRERMSYPTNIYMDEHFQGPVSIPGYQSVPQLETLLMYLTSGMHKKNVGLEEYSKTYTPKWEQ